MQTTLEKRLLTLQLFLRGALAQGLAAMGVGALADMASAVSFALGGIALLAGHWAASVVALRGVAPSGTDAALGVVFGAVLKWILVAGLLLAAMVAPDARPFWVLLGLIAAQVVLVLAVLTFKRQ